MATASKSLLSVLPDSGSSPKPSVSVLDRLHESPTQFLTSAQIQADGMVENFIDQASDWRALAALTAGGWAYRYGRMGIMALGNGHVAAMPLRFLSAGFGLTTEVTAFEFTNRTLSTLFRATGQSPLQNQSPETDHSSPQLWSWSGTGGWKEGWLASFVTFASLKGVGRFTEGQNLPLQHLSQDFGMVFGHYLAHGIGLEEKPEGSFADQLAHAEAINLQLGFGNSLSHELSAGRLPALERSLDLRLRIQDTRLKPASELKLASASSPEIFPLWAMMGMEGDGGNKSKEGKYSKPKIPEDWKLPSASSPMPPLCLTPDLEEKIAKFLEPVDKKGLNIVRTPFKGGQVHVFSRPGFIHMALLKDGFTRPFLVFQTDGNHKITRILDARQFAPFSREGLLSLLETAKQEVVFFQALIDAYRISEMRETDEAEEAIQKVSTKTPRRLKGPTIEVPRGQKAPNLYVLGRKSMEGEKNFILIPDVSVSRRHAQIAAYPEGSLTIRDLGSTQGTWILRPRSSKPEKVGDKPLSFNFSDQILLGGDGTVEEAIHLKFGKDGKVLHSTPLISSSPPSAPPIQVVHDRSDHPQDQVLSRHPNGKIAELHLFFPQRHYGVEFPRGSVLSFDSQGLLRSVFLSEDTEILGIPCSGGTSVSFDEFGLLEEVTLASPIREGKVLHPAGSRIDFRVKPQDSPKK